MLTGDPKWYDAVNRILEQFEEQQYKTYLPGMWPVTINAQQMDFAGDSLFTLSAMSDSLYEYFPKVSTAKLRPLEKQPLINDMPDARTPRRNRRKIPKTILRQHDYSNKLQPLPTNDTRRSRYPNLRLNPQNEPNFRRSPRSARPTPRLLRGRNVRSRQPTLRH